jgi:uncharacterized membrane protein YadS
MPPIAFDSLDHADVTLIVVAFIGLMGTLAIGLMNLYNSHANSKRLKTGNDRDIGDTVHDIAQTMEIVQAQGHLNAKELMALGEKVDRHWDSVSPLVERMEQKEGLSNG